MRAFTGTKIIHAALSISVVINVFLARELSRLRTALYESKTAPALQAGVVVPPIEGVTPGGSSRLVIRYSDVTVPTVLYVFTPQCIWCRRNVDNLRILIDKAGLHYRVIGISLSSEGLVEYLTNLHLTLPVLTDIDPANKVAYRFGATPTTIVVSPQSVVLRAWSGAYQDDIKTQIEGYLKIKLPGCCKGSSDELASYSSH